MPAHDMKVCVCVCACVCVCVCGSGGSAPFVLNLDNKWYESSAQCFGNFNQGRDGDFQ